jgi:hypothetical protein
MEDPTHVSTVSMQAPGSAAIPVPIPLISPKAQEEATQRCTICNSLFNLPRPDGLIEKASILPCSHVFGHICIQRWLETDSLHQDCPICRRPMLYRVCGHVIKACEADKAPKGVSEGDMPERCAKCRSGGDGEEGGLDNELSESRRMMEVQKSALEGMRQHLPGVFGGMCRSTVQSVDGRIEELKQEWERETDAAFGEVEEKHGRLEW